MSRGPEPETVPKQKSKTAVKMRRPDDLDRKDLAQDPEVPRKQKEIGGPSGPEPTRYGDWERKGRCVDF